MADLEDAPRRPGTTSSRASMNLTDAVRRTITFDNPEGANTSSTTRPRPCWCARAAGTSRRGT